ncbi:MAG: hypothetical protein H0W40_09090 [Methylibium sp.]|uniref:hypothetical protein n=1 Tax=Methylibium sp. TaxID=2067992 RepID=UPI00182BC921|nr:hypothetical protein [Methylibium sp.]MBA3597521.1 hypothetical protein [Methylibium sp.]
MTKPHHNAGALRPLGPPSVDSSFRHSRYLAITPPVLALMFALALWLALDPATLKEITTEGGLVERPTELLYFALAAAMWWWRRPGDDLLGWTALCIVFVAFGAREMDLHKAWTGGSMLKLSFYLREAPLVQKLVSGAVVLMVAAAGVFVIRCYAYSVWQGLRRRETVATTVAIFLGTMIVSKVFDRSINILAEDFDIVAPVATGVLVGAVEEILELSLPLVAAIGFVQHRRGNLS